jgi:hypothetical protein
MGVLAYGRVEVMRLADVLADNSISHVDLLSIGPTPLTILILVD